MYPCVTGLRWSPSTLTTRPSTTRTSKLQASGQSSGQALVKISGGRRGSVMLAACVALDRLHDGVRELRRGRLAAEVAGADLLADDHIAQSPAHPLSHLVLVHVEEHHDP